MQQQEICEILKQIIPELEAKIREELKAEYEQRVLDIQKYYQTQIEALVQKQNQLKLQLASKQSSNKKQVIKDKEKQELIRRVAVLESQRKNWYTLQTQYQATIQQLTNLLSTLSLSSNQGIQNTSPISNSIAHYASIDFNSVNTIHPPPQSCISENLCKPSRKQQIPKQIQPDHKSPNSQSSSSSSILQNSLCKYLNISQKQSNSDHQNKSHYHSVLSPPKDESSTQTKRLFWDQNKKKQLLSLIKFN